MDMYDWNKTFHLLFLRNKFSAALFSYTMYIISDFSMCAAGLRTGVAFQTILQLYIL